jgi:molybdenum cofactor guanylyltransferase
MSVKMSISGFVQAGGKSSRMGLNKALLQLGGRSLIEHVLAALSPLVSQIGIVTSSPSEYSHLGVDCYSDRWPGQGPLGGIGTALSQARNDYSLILACDMPFVTGQLLESLVESGRGYEVCVPQGADGELQPLCALYHRSCLSRIESLISQGRYSPRSLFEEAHTRLVPFESFAKLEGSDRFFENLNTPEDFVRARKINAKERKRHKK